MRIYYSTGRPVRGELLPLPSTAKYSEMGALYALNMKVNIKDRKKLNDENFSKVKEEMYRKYHAKVKYFEVRETRGGEQYALMQLSGSPFEFAALLEALPGLMTILGLVVIGIAVYYVVKKHPAISVFLLLGLLMFGGALLGLLRRGGE